VTLLERISCGGLHDFLWRWSGQASRLGEVLLPAGGFRVPRYNSAVPAHGAVAPSPQRRNLRGEASV
jgi:hypothetical protein